MLQTEDPYVAVEGALTPLEQAVIKREVVAAHPDMEGATVAEMLASRPDTYVEWTEPFYDADGTRGPLPRNRTFYADATVLACAMLCHRKPENIEVAELLGRCFMFITDQVTDGAALNEIQELMSAKEWSPNTLAAIADVVRCTGREIEDTEG